MPNDNYRHLIDDMLDHVLNALARFIERTFTDEFGDNWLEKQRNDAVWNSDLMLGRSPDSIADVNFSGLIRIISYYKHIFGPKLGDDGLARAKKLQMVRNRICHRTSRNKHVNEHEAHIAIKLGYDFLAEILSAPEEAKKVKDLLKS